MVDVSKEAVLGKEKIKQQENVMEWERLNEWDEVGVGGQSLHRIVIVDSSGDVGARVEENRMKE